ncbi:hypothetical protein [Quadrisphaera sp. KR29]|uniref:hypothetical protein n=1 Tax=Quadrisphaera sp. KR29 TaxID=3461391 RepID=UPI0040442EC5
MRSPAAVPGPVTAEPSSSGGPPADGTGTPRRQPPGHLGRAYRVAFSETGALEVVLPPTEQAAAPRATAGPAAGPAPDGGPAPRIAAPRRPSRSGPAGPAVHLPSADRAGHHERPTPATPAAAAVPAAAAAPAAPAGSPACGHRSEDARRSLVVGLAVGVVLGLLLGALLTVLGAALLGVLPGWS